MSAIELKEQPIDGDVCDLFGVGEKVSFINIQSIKIETELSNLPVDIITDKTEVVILSGNETKRMPICSIIQEVAYRVAKIQSNNSRLHKGCHKLVIHKALLHMEDIEYLWRIIKRDLFWCLSFSFCEFETSKCLFRDRKYLKRLGDACKHLNIGLEMIECCRNTIDGRMVVRRLQPTRFKSASHTDAYSLNIRNGTITIEEDTKKRKEYSDPSTDFLDLSSFVSAVASIETETKDCSEEHRSTKKRRL